MEEETKTTETEQNKQPDSEPTKPETEKAPSAPESSDSVQDAQESPDKSELTALRAELARAQTERTACIEAVKMGVSPQNVGYVLKLAELPESGKTEDITSAIQKVLDDVPAFRSETSANRPQIRIGAKRSDAEQSEDALAKAFGNKK